MTVNVLRIYRLLYFLKRKKSEWYWKHESLFPTLFLFMVCNNPLYSVSLSHPAAHCRNWSMDTARNITDTAFSRFKAFSTHSRFSTSQLCENLDYHSESKAQPFPALLPASDLWALHTWAFRDLGGSLFRHGKWESRWGALLKSQSSVRHPW